MYFAAWTTGARRAHLPEVVLRVAGDHLRRGQVSKPEITRLVIGLEPLRGVAFEFRAKAPLPHKDRWDRTFFVGSLITSLSQGFILGLYIMGLKWGLAEVAFATLTAMALAAGYGFIGAAWLILKTDLELQRKAVGWARRGIWGLVLGMTSVSLATPLVSPRIFAKWFSFPEVVLLVPLPVMLPALNCSVNRSPRLVVSIAARSVLNVNRLTPPRTWWPVSLTST